MNQDYLCEYCDRICKNAMSLAQHRLRCEKNPGNRKAEMPIPSRKGKYVGKTASELTLKRKRNKERRTNDLFLCEHCGQERDSFLGLKIHETRCSSNPLGKPVIISEETKRKLSIANRGKKMSDEFRLKVSEGMKRAILENPESYTSSNRGRVKQIIIDGVKLHGSWEAAFYSWAKKNDLKPERCLNGFDYFWNGKERKYFPDFYLPNLNLYVEVKGYETEQDREKWRQFPERIIVLRRPEINMIKNDLPNLVDRLGLEPRTIAL
jgi:hypothetical protein